MPGLADHGAERAAGHYDRVNHELLEDTEEQKSESNERTRIMIVTMEKSRVGGKPVGEGTGAKGSPNLQVNEESGERAVASVGRKRRGWQAVDAGDDGGDNRTRRAPPKAASEVFPTLRKADGEKVEPPNPENADGEPRYTLWRGVHVVPEDLDKVPKIVGLLRSQEEGLDNHNLGEEEVTKQATQVTDSEPPPQPPTCNDSGEPPEVGIGWNDAGVTSKLGIVKVRSVAVQGISRKPLDGRGEEWQGQGVSGPGLPEPRQGRERERGELAKPQQHLQGTTDLTGETKHIVVVGSHLGGGHGEGGVLMVGLSRVGGDLGIDVSPGGELRISFDISLHGVEQLRVGEALSRGPERMSHERDADQVAVVEEPSRVGVDLLAGDENEVVRVTAVGDGDVQTLSKGRDEVLSRKPTISVRTLKICAGVVSFGGVGEDFAAVLQRVQTREAGRLAEGRLRRYDSGADEGVELRVFVEELAHDEGGQNLQGIVHPHDGG